MLEIITKIYEIINNFFQAIRNPFFDFIFHYISFLGTMEAFIFALFVSFILLKRDDFFVFLFSSATSMLTNTLIKELVKRPRPYTKVNVIVPDNVFTEGYSFPSGHNQNVSTFASVSIYHKNKPLTIFFIILMILMPITRMYLAQHYFTDCIVGLIIGLGITYISLILFSKIKDKLYIPIYILSIISLPLMIFVSNSLVITFGPLLLTLGIGYFLTNKVFKIDVNLDTLKKKLLGLLIGLLPIILIFIIFNFFELNNFLVIIKYLTVGGYIFGGFPFIMNYVIRIIQKEV
jgi:undecaprenyl-diphosphatase